MPPPPSVTQRPASRALILVAPRPPAVPRRSRGSPSLLPRTPVGASSLHGSRRAQLRTPDRRGGPYLGTSRRARSHRDCAPGTASAASTSPRPNGGTPSSASHRKPCLRSSPSLRTCEQTSPEAPLPGVPPRSPLDSLAARRFLVRPHRPGRAAVGARRRVFGHRYRPSRADSPICEARATWDGSPAQISLLAPCT